MLQANCYKKYRERLALLKHFPKNVFFSGEEVDFILRLEFPNESSINTKEGWYKVVTQKLLTSYGNKEYCIGIS